MVYEDPIAFFLTWTTYGTWLPGDERGWVEHRHGYQLPKPILELESAARMTEDACRLDTRQRVIVHNQIAENCSHKRWELLAVNCRSNHVHVVVSAIAHPKTIRSQLKAWCSQRLNESEVVCGVAVELRRTQWWTERGSTRWIFREADLAAAVEYVLECQDDPRRYLAK